MGTQRPVCDTAEHVSLARSRSMRRPCVTIVTHKRSRLDPHLVVGETVILLHPPSPSSRCFNTDE